MPPSVAIIGAGPLGLMALKNFREDGFDVTAFEARPYVGGLWQYSNDSSLSVAESTIFNSSRYRSAISDFPFPDDTDDFPTWQQLHAYLEGYVDKFNLRPHIKLNCPVTRLTRKDGRWRVEISPKDVAGQKTAKYFDKVVVAIGSLVQAKQPKFDGIEKFEGKTQHAINFHRSANFKGQNVVLVGLHATAQDVAVCFQKDQANKLYISHRSGIILFPRYLPDGMTYDQMQTVNFTMFQIFMWTWFPTVFNWILDKAVRWMSAKAFPDVPKSWKFSPAPSFAITPPLIADELYPLMKSGFAEPVAEVSKILGPKSIQLTDGRVLEDIDSIIYCTGYDLCVPFIPPEHNPYEFVGDTPKLFHGTFSLHPDPEVRNSIAFLGHGALNLTGFVMYELNAMAISQTWLGKSPLPPYEEMLQWHRNWLEWRRSLMKKQKMVSSFYVALISFPDHFQWLNSQAGSGLLEHFSWTSWRCWQFWWNEPKLYKKCKTGLMSPALWRLFDMGKRKPWSKAREQILFDNDIAEKRLAERVERMKQVNLGCRDHNAIWLQNTNFTQKAMVAGQ